MQVGRPLSVDQPEGNGTGWMYDREGHVVTNFHVLGSALSGAAKGKANGQRVARVTLLGPPPRVVASSKERGRLRGVARFLNWHTAAAYLSVGKKASWGHPPQLRNDA